MGLFVDPQATTVLTFPDDHPIEGLRGEAITVRDSVSDSEWQEWRAGVMDAVAQGETFHLAFSGENGIKRLALWIEGVSFMHPKHGRYPRNRADRMRWLGDLWPPAADAIREVLDAHVQRMWTIAQPEPHPKPEPSPARRRTAPSSPETGGSDGSGTT